MEETVHVVDVEMSPVQETVDTKEVVLKWFEKFEMGVLASSHFKDYWRTWVPRVYSPGVNDNCLHFNFNEDEATRILFSPLEEFICKGDPAVVLQDIMQRDKKPSVCGRVFKQGEPTYCCRECGMDTTCVLCVDCFKQSEHRHHKYKMGTSCGGGCCDCGDKEAWKKDPYCATHALGLQEEQGKLKLPEDLAERTRIVFEASLWYAYNLLTLEHTADLGLKNSEDELYDAYCTVLYNDESHTFEQVISTLNRVIKCPQRTAIEYVTNIDREGRAMVKCSNFQHCSNLRTEIEKYTSRHGSKPLKVLVVHAHVVAHQIFALKLLSWMQTFLGHGEGFRKIFSEIALKPQQADPCIIKGILLRDSQLWKSARTHWHTLIISGMLLEYENKKAFAKIFMKNYGSVMKDFIKDDHDHTFSISSLSVQLFTVPTIAHHLIACDDALFILLNTFLSECSRRLNKINKLEFERNSPNQTFKRAQYMLYDLRYLLSTVPPEWTDDLRRYFLQGLSTLLNLLAMMQGMDAVTRQVGQHMEYEPEWETAFNLHIKLAYCISLALQWCGSDRVVLIKAYRATMKKLVEINASNAPPTSEVVELVDHCVTCYPYDVSTKPVSIHLPLSRFLAGLHLHLEKYGLSFDGIEFQIAKPSPVQIIEYVLRTQVMIAQVHAGMWRRNGYALLNQLYFYHNVKCRSEMLDRDINLLQVGATLIESNEFLIHLLYKFNLYNWANLNYETNTSKPNEEDSVRQTITLLEEFLQLLIVIVGERYMPGISNVTPQDRIKKEIIQHLCIKPLLHSELYRIVPDDILNHDTGIDDVIHDIAAFKKPTQGTGQGVYELKDHLYKEYNIFFYHYTREELSKSEEAQRKRHKAAGELECCPPPHLPKLTDNFSMLVNLLQCDVMLHVMQLVVERAICLRAKSFSELQLHKILHLIGYALQEEQSGNYPFFVFVEKSAKYKIFQLLEELSKSPRVEAHKDLIRWTLNLYKQMSVVSHDINEESTSSAVATASEVVEQDKEGKEKERRAKLAALRREKVMAQMAAMQNSFIKENAQLFEETNSELPEKEAEQIEEIEIENTAALGSPQKFKLYADKYYVCILCQEEQKVSIDGPALVLAAFVQQATVLCRSRNSSVEGVSNEPLYLNSNLGPAPYTSTCGHVMHSTCWQRYFENVAQKETRRPYRMRHPASFDIEKQEFLCPLCECLSNTVLPLLPSLTILETNSKKSNLAFGDFLTCVDAVLESKVKTCHGTFKCKDDVRTPCANCDNFEVTECDDSCDEKSHRIFRAPKLEDLEEVLGEKFQEFKVMFPECRVELSTNLKEILLSYAQAPYTRGLGVAPHPTDRRIAPMGWKSLAYTIHTIEMLSRDSNKALLGNLSSRHRDCIESFVRIAGVLGNTCLPDTVIASHAMKLLSLIIEGDQDLPSILQWDSFGFLTALTFSLPSLFGRGNSLYIPTGGELDLYALRLVFTAHIVKILLEKAIEKTNEMDVDNPSDAGGEGVTKINLTDLINKYKEATLWETVKYSALPFLRCAVLFYHHVTDFPALPELLEIGGDTFENMCKYLNLQTTLPELFNDDRILFVANKWVTHPEVTNFITGEAFPSLMQPHHVNRLVELPYDYSDLINTVSSFTCPNRDHDDSRNPTMCLVCGEILCSQSYCCQTEVNKIVVGACNYHAIKCGGGVGVFLRIRDCEILFLVSPHRGCFLSTPYLDDYGETDQGLKRGNPLKLSADLYKKFQTIWLSHTVHEEIARSIEASYGNTILPTQWQHL